MLVVRNVSCFIRRGDRTDDLSSLPSSFIHPTQLLTPNSTKLKSSNLKSPKKKKWQKSNKYPYTHAPWQSPQRYRFEFRRKWQPWSSPNQRLLLLLLLLLLPSPEASAPRAASVLALIRRFPPHEHEKPDHQHRIGNRNAQRRLNNGSHQLGIRSHRSQTNTRNY